MVDISSFALYLKKKKFYLVKSCFLYNVSKFIVCVCFLCLSLMIMKIDISYLAQILGCLCFGFA